MSNKFKLMIAALVVVIILTTVIATTVFAAPQGLTDNAAPVYCGQQQYCNGANSITYQGSGYCRSGFGNNGYPGEQYYGGASCH